MTDRVYPSAKTNGAAAATPAAANPPAFPAPKSQLYNQNRHPYRPQPAVRRNPRRRRRRCFCLCCFWSILILTALLLLAAIAGAAVYVLYRPRAPTFSVSALRMSQFNLSTAAADDTTHLSSRLNLTIFAKNPNKKLIFFYDPIAITVISSNEVTVANGSFPSFTSNPMNSTLVRSQLSSTSQVLDAESVTALRSDLKRKLGVPLRIVMDTDVVVKMDGLKSKKVGIRINCQGIHCQPPKGKSPSIASTSGAKCKVDLRIKIWKFTF